MTLSKGEIPAVLSQDNKYNLPWNDFLEGHENTHEIIYG